MRRREFILLVGAGSAAQPLRASAEQGNRVPIVGVLVMNPKNDPAVRAVYTALEKQLRGLGWTDGQNLRIDYRYAEGDPARLPGLAKELVESQPDVILAPGLPALRAARECTLSIPIVFAQVTDPVALGFVASLARPSGNITGFTNFESSIGGKWLQILKECVPAVGRVVIVFDSGAPQASPFLRSLEAAAPSLGVQLTPAAVENDADIELAIDAYAKEPNSALIVLPGVIVTGHRERIVSSANRNRLPAVYPLPIFTSVGGLIAYGVDQPDLFRRTASYVDRILKGAKPGDLPVQQPTKFEFVINLKTAKAIGLDIPQSLLARADEVIE